MNVEHKKRLLKAGAVAAGLIAVLVPTGCGGGFQSQMPPAPPPPQGTG